MSARTTVRPFQPSPFRSRFFIAWYLLCLCINVLSAAFIFHDTLAGAALPFLLSVIEIPIFWWTIQNRGPLWDRLNVARLRSRSRSSRALRAHIDWGYINDLERALGLPVSEIPEYWYDADLHAACRLRHAYATVAVFHSITYRECTRCHHRIAKQRQFQNEPYRPIDRQWLAGGAFRNFVPHPDGGWRPREVTPPPHGPIKSVVHSPSQRRKPAVHGGEGYEWEESLQPFTSREQTATKTFPAPAPASASASGWRWCDGRVIPPGDPLPGRDHLIRKSGVGTLPYEHDWRRVSDFGIVDYWECAKCEQRVDKFRRPPVKGCSMSDPSKYWELSEVQPGNVSACVHEWCSVLTSQGQLLLILCTKCNARHVVVSAMKAQAPGGAQ